MADENSVARVCGLDTPCVIFEYALHQPRSSAHGVAAARCVNAFLVITVLELVKLMKFQLSKSRFEIARVSRILRLGCVFTMFLRNTCFRSTSCYKLLMDITVTPYRPSEITLLRKNMMIFLELVFDFENCDWSHISDAHVAAVKSVRVSDVLLIQLPHYVFWILFCISWKCRWKIAQILILFQSS